MLVYLLGVGDGVCSVIGVSSEALAESGVNFCESWVPYSFLLDLDLAGSVFFF